MGRGWFKSIHCCILHQEVRSRHDLKVGMLSVRPQAPLRVEGQSEKSFGTLQTNITPFLSLGFQRSQFSEDVTDKRDC